MCQIYILVNEYKVFVPCTVRAGTGGDEAAIWTGDLVGTCFPLFLPASLSDASVF